jgi:ribosomal RNA-processing protein 1
VVRTIVFFVAHLVHCFNSPNDIRVPTSLAYHIADIYVEELDKALGTTQNHLPAPMAVVLGPFFTLAAQTSNLTTYKRIQSAVIEPFLSSLGPVSPLIDEPPKSKKRRICEEASLAKNACFTSASEGKVDGLELRRMLLRRIFEIASEPTTKESNRRRMYTFWKENYDDPEET